MALHLLKLCVGIETVDELAKWQSAHLKAQIKRGKAKAELQHVTRQMPKRADEILAGGSLYWVIKGQIALRQKILELRPVTRTGTPHCAIIYDKKLILVARRTHRAFQGWRYLKAEDAPPDARGNIGGDGLPEDLKAELVNLGLL